MENKEEIELKPRTKKSFIDKIKGIFDDKKKRGLYVFLFVLPFIIAMCIFGIVAYKEAKSLLNLATGSVEVNDENTITEMNYFLRNNATDYQKECFEELKKSISENSDHANIAGLVCKNYVADFYTWTNKQGQYDVGGLCYVFNLEKTKSNIYTQARDEFYKYLSNYIKEYGASNLLEVDNIVVTNASKLSYPYVCLVNTHQYNDQVGHYYEDLQYTYDEAYEVTCSWTYKENSKFDTSSYCKKMNFIVVNNNGRYEIVETSENTINARKVENKVEE